MSNLKGKTQHSCRGIEVVLGARGRRLNATYRRLLRYAATAGWQNAKLEYLGRRTGQGIPREDVLDDLEVIDGLYVSAFVGGVDPVITQRRRDVDLFVLLPLGSLIGSLIVATSAFHGNGMLATIFFGCVAVATVRKLGRHVVRSMKG